MRLPISKLQFRLPDALLTQYEYRLDIATENIKKIARDSGTHSDRYKRALQRFSQSLQQGRSLLSVLRSPVELRVLALLLKNDTASIIELTPAVLNKIDQIRAKPSSLFLEAVYSYYLKHYDQLKDVRAVESWLRKGKEVRGELTDELKHLLGGNGPKWLAEESHRRRSDFDEQVQHLRLDLYQSGRFLTVSKNIYYLDLLRGLRPNEFHSILNEMQMSSVYNSRYDESTLLGHQILRILINKAPDSGVNEAWLKVVLAIGGDPRVPRSHRNYIRWWSQLGTELKGKVEGWLSKLDLKLFLEALEDFSDQPANKELKRMYPARKHFMEGLLNKKLVTRTWLFLSYSAEQYLKGIYQPEHLPNYSLVDGERSLICIQLGKVHLVEGSHNCKLWIYERLDPSAAVFDDTKKQFTYRSLTGGLRDQMENLGIYHVADITHTSNYNGNNYSWQRNAITALNGIGVQIDSEDILSAEDHRKYKRLYGA